jgi:hypothetical protein
MAALWDGKTTLEVAVMVDIDGTLAGVYHDGTRDVREEAAEALAMLSAVAPVCLWSLTGADNCRRLLEERPDLAQYVSYVSHKIGFPLERIRHAFCIDDQEAEHVVMECDRVIIDTYYEGKSSGQLLEAARLVVDAIEKVTNRD